MHNIKSYLDSIAAVEKEKLELEKRTIDFVAPGEQQPEVDHAMQSNQFKIREQPGSILSRSI